MAEGSVDETRLKTFALPFRFLLANTEDLFVTCICVLGPCQCVSPDSVRSNRCKCSALLVTRYFAKRSVVFNCRALSLIFRSISKEDALWRSDHLATQLETKHLSLFSTTSMESNELVRLVVRRLCEGLSFEVLPFSDFLRLPIWFCWLCLDMVCVMTLIFSTMSVICYSDNPSNLVSHRMASFQKKKTKTKTKNKKHDNSNVVRNTSIINLH